MSFIELQNFVIYQHVNKKTTMVSLATFHIAHKCNQLNHLTLRCQFLCHVLKTVFSIKIALKLSYFCKKKCKIFQHWGLRPQTPVPPAAGSFALPPYPHWSPAAGGSAPRARISPLLQISGYARGCFSGIFVYTNPKRQEKVPNKTTVLCQKVFLTSGTAEIAYSAKVG